MEAKKEHGELVRRALEIFRDSQAAAQQPTASAIEKENPAELLAATVLSESAPDEVTPILDVWQRIFGIRLDRRRVIEHLRALREWQGRTP